jgi:hypothetical protein
MSCRRIVFALSSILLVETAGAGEEYSNSWILPAYAAGQRAEFNIDDTLAPPIATFFPPMAGWCLGKTAKVGLPLVHDLGVPPPAAIRFLADESLNDKVQADQVRICLDGYTAHPPEYDRRLTQVLNLTQSQATELHLLHGEISRMQARQRSLEETIDALRRKLGRALVESRRIQAELSGRLGQAKVQLQASENRIASLESENGRLRSELSRVQR